VTISRKAKEAIKTALAMTIAYDIALSLGWDRPMWAGFAVAFISLATVGQSLNKGAMRMLGTFVGVGVALVIIALTAQERWHFIFILSVYIGFCTYMMSGAKHSYFWNVSGFVCAIICFDAGPNSENAFSLAMLRAQETGLGILVYSLIAFLIWPSSSRNEFYAIVQKLSSTQPQLLHAYFQLLTDSSNTKQAQTLRLQEIQIRTQFSALLDAAETDSHEVKEMRQQWRLYQSKAVELVEAMERLRNSFAKLQELDVYQLLPNLEEFRTEIHERLKQIEQMFVTKKIDHHPTDISLKLDRDKADTLLNFQKASLALSYSQFQHLDKLTRDLFNIVKDIKECKHTKKQVSTAQHSNSMFVLDVDRFSYAIRVMMIMFLAYLSVIYIDDIPGKFTIVTIATVFGMFVSAMPQLSVWLLLMPALLGISFAGFVYIFLMPQISSFIELGPLIFGVTFVICYLFATPKQALGRVFGLAMFIVITGINNQQSYSFLSVANTALMFPLAFMIISITAYLPISWIPEHVFERLLKRYFYSCAYVLPSKCEKSQKHSSFVKNYKDAFHANEIVKLPLKLNFWVKHIGNKEKSGATTEQIQALVNSLETLTLRVQDFQKIQKDPQAFVLEQEMQNDMQVWYQQMQDTLQKLSEEPTAEKLEVFRSKLDEIVEHFEQHIERTLNKIDTAQFSKQDGENFYRLLGAFRSVSEALVDCASNAKDIDWTQWREERFA